MHSFHPALTNGGSHIGLRTLGCWDSLGLDSDSNPKFRLQGEVSDDAVGCELRKSDIWGLMERTLILHPTKQACFESVLLCCADLGPSFLNCNRAFGTKRKNTENSPCSEYFTTATWAHKQLRTNALLPCSYTLLRTHTARVHTHTHTKRLKGDCWVQEVTGGEIDACKTKGDKLWVAGPPDKLQERREKKNKTHLINLACALSFVFLS